tara:strand:+ start:3711 stop:4121 length:411 start_codon:yes stop_codon:yes gene_type:complete
MDDQMSTPISSIYPPTQHSQREQPHQGDMFPPPPHVQSNGQKNGFYNQMHEHMQQQAPEKKEPVVKEDTDMDKTQQELMFLFVIILVISSEPVQRQLMSSFPSLFSDAKSSIVASAINAGVICGLFYALRHVKITV